MQGPYGSTESSSADSDTISPVQTWDSKINSLVAAIGGAVDILAVRLASDEVLSRFNSVVWNEYSRVFTQSASEMPIALPCQ